MQRGGRKRREPGADADSASSEGTQRLELHVLNGACCQPACRALLPTPEQVSISAGPPLPRASSQHRPSSPRFPKVPKQP